MDTLEANSHRPLTMVIAPAGYGKSTLVSQWLEDSGRQHIWLSLDVQMNTEAEFLKYFISALRHSFPHNFKNLEAYEQQVHVLKGEKIIEIIIKDLLTLEDDLFLVCDDFHLISNPQLKEFITLLISSTLSGVHWVLITRSEFSFSLDEPYLFDKLNEIRMTDLAFSSDELKLLIESRQYGQPDKDRLDKLLALTEGWILGLTMMLRYSGDKISLDGGLNAAEKKAAFVNLADQLIDQLPEGMAELVPIAALCDYFNKDLLDQLIQAIGIMGITGEKFIKALKQHNFFYIKLLGIDNSYRMHHFFQDILRKRLKADQPAMYQKIILIINDWYLANGLIDEAIRSAVYSENYDLAITIIDEYRFTVLDKDQWWRLNEWVELFPENIRNGNAILLLTRLWALENTVKLGDFRPILAVLDQILSEKSDNLLLSEYHFHKAWFHIFVDSDILKA